MLVKTVHVRPSHPMSGWQELKDALKGASMAAALVDSTVDWRTFMGVARVIALSNVRVIAAYGERGEELHDLVDLIALSERATAPITTWESDGLDVFMSNVTFTYRGLLDIADQVRQTTVCYVSERESVPEDLSMAIDRMRARQL